MDPFTVSPNTQTAGRFLHVEMCYLMLETQEKS